uniref:Phage virion morphogenesis protein n=1 Tax=candidate division WOR-3 bacterium TaxID=2052148 RepID=A0A7C6A7U5_UNCW3
MESIFGFTQLSRYLSRLQDQFNSRLHNALQDAALLVEKAAKENIIYGRADWPALKQPGRRLARVSRRQRTPLLDTGTLLRSIHSQVEEFQAVIGSGVKYAPTHEFGTERAGRTHSIRIPKRPYLTPAIEENLRQIKEIFIKRLQGR